MTTPPNKSDEVEQVAEKIVDEAIEMVAMNTAPKPPNDAWEWFVEHIRIQLHNDVRIALSSERAKQREANILILENICNRPKRQGEPSTGICHVKEAIVAIRKAGGG